ncbi:MAG: sugar ABC transporter substrate-binding protein [Anaerolineae bacterium]|nr:sugar ABC transporter substrate-binding protein [Anaerolineae bacterium]
MKQIEKGYLSAAFVLALAAILFVACGAPAAPPAQTVRETVVVPQTVVAAQTVVAPQTVVVPQTVVAEQTVVVQPTAAPNPEAVIKDVEPNAEVSLWTFWLSPTFDDYIKSTIARFEATYPGVKVNWEDHQATFQDDLRNAFAAGNAPDVINLSVGEGWVSDYATKGLLLPLDDKVPQDVKDLYFKGLWEEQLVDGVNYQFPWYQGISVELVNMKVYSDGAGLKLEDFPKTVDGLPELCQTIKDKTGTLCNIRLTVNDLLAQMVYEGGVKILSEDGKTCTFDSADGAAWLQMYVDMVKAGTVDRSVLVTDQDRVGLDLFTSGNSAFYQTGPNLIREVRANNPGLYGYLAAVPAPVGKSGVLGKGLMGISVKNDTKFPNASIALAQFFTNPESMLEFSKIVAVYPSTPKSYDDPFFAAKPIAVEDSAKPIAKDIVSKYADIVPTVPNKADVNEAVLQAVQSALFDNVPVQDALTTAAKACTELINK